MGKFTDFFSLRRRRASRIAVDWMVDARLPGSTCYSGFFARDINLRGLRLEGGSPESVRRLLTPEGRTLLGLRLPGHRRPLPELEAELRWGLGEPGHFRTGWHFTYVPHDTLEELQAYIEAHPEDLLEGH